MVDAATARDVLDAFRLLEGRLQGSGRKLTPGARELVEIALRSVRVSEGQPLAPDRHAADDGDVLQLLTYDEVADRLQVSVSSVKREVRDGDLRVVDVKGAVRFRPADVAEYIDNQLRST